MAYQLTQADLDNCRHEPSFRQWTDAEIQGYFDGKYAAALSGVTEAKATQEQKDAAEAVVLEAIAAFAALPEPGYEAKRQNEYPPIGDQLDMLWKQLNQDRLGGKSLIQEADDMLNAILAVKAKYLKPS